jgi:hypothetical protein
MIVGIMEIRDLEKGLNVTTVNQVDTSNLGKA